MANFLLGIVATLLVAVIMWLWLMVRQQNTLLEAMLACVGSLQKAQVVLTAHSTLHGLIEKRLTALQEAEAKRKPATIMSVASEGKA